MKLQCQTTKGLPMCAITALNKSGCPVGISDGGGWGGTPAYNYRGCTIIGELGVLPVLPMPCRVGAPTPLT